MRPLMGDTELQERVDQIDATQDEILADIDGIGRTLDDHFELMKALEHKLDQQFGNIKLLVGALLQNKSPEVIMRLICLRPPEETS